MYVQPNRKYNARLSQIENLVFFYVKYIVPFQVKDNYSHPSTSYQNKE